MSEPLSAHGEWGGPDPGRAAEVVSLPGDPEERGSGYLVTQDLVMTAAHLVAGSSAAQVRFFRGRRGEWSARAEVVWSSSELDLALLRMVSSSLTGRDGVPPVSPVAFGCITQPTRCEALGYPRFKLRRRAGLQGHADGQLPYSDTRHAIGVAAPLSNWRSGLLEISVQAPLRYPNESVSPWEGMAGASVWSDGYLIGVVRKHGPDDALNILTASRVERWYDYLDEGARSVIAGLIGLPVSVGDLRVVNSGVDAFAIPRQLPSTTAAFVGREEELSDVRRVISSMPGQESGGTLVISAIDGMGGIGKTSLALQVAHRVSAQFPDGQLFVDLQGFTADLEPLSPAEALHRMLRSLGVQPQQIPDDTDGRAALYRSRLSGSRTLVLLDNAASSQQVRPLLPGAGECLVIITSRKHLTGIDVTHSLSLDVLPMQDAIALFRKVATAERVPEDHPLLPELMALCGNLPLAIRIVAARLRHRRFLRIEDIVDQLRDEQTRLESLEDDYRNLAAIFAVSYRHIPVPAQLMFRRLGLIPGPDFDSYTAANLLGIGHADADRLLEILFGHHLLVQRQPGRFRFHDLVRVYARSIGAADPAEDSEAAATRLLDYYQYVADEADRRLVRYTPRRNSAAAPLLSAVPPLRDRGSALTWMRAERTNLLNAISYAAANDQSGRVVILTSAIASFLEIDGPWSQAAGLHTEAASIAASGGDVLGQANALFELARICCADGEYTAAIGHQEHAQALYESAADDLGVANTQYEIGRVRFLTDHYGDAIGLQRQALKAYQANADRLGAANALNELARISFLTDDYHAAVEFHERALEIYQLLGDHLGEADVLRELGRARYLTGDISSAAAMPEQALGIYRQLRYRQGEADALCELGRLEYVTGSLATAAGYHAQALAIFEDLGHRQGAADALWDLGRAQRSMGDFTNATTSFQRALDIFRELGDRHGEAYAIHELGRIRRLTGEFGCASSLQDSALAIFQELEGRQSEANVLQELGRLHHAASEYSEAACSFERALSIFQEIGDRQGESEVRNSLGALLRDSEEPISGLEAHSQALSLAREVRSPIDEAQALAGIGYCRCSLGDTEGGADLLRQALTILNRAASCEAEAISEYLATNDL